MTVHQKIYPKGITLRISIDNIVGEVERQFESPSLYAKMELLLQSAAEGKEIPGTLLTSQK